MLRSVKCAVAGLSLLTLAAAAPVWADPPASQPAEHGPRARGDRGDQLQKTLDQLNLTDDQKKQIQPIVDKLKTDMHDLMEDKSVSKDEKRTKAKELNTDAMQNIEAILTPEQKAKIKEIRDQQPKRGPRDGAKKGPGDGPKPGGDNNGK